jgi:hypothetical protein
MWDAEPLQVDHSMVIQKYVKVNVAWALLYEFPPTHQVLNILQLVQKIQWLEVSLDLQMTQFRYHIGRWKETPETALRTSHAAFMNLS